jgi:hypothetical protein
MLEKLARTALLLPKKPKKQPKPKTKTKKQPPTGLNHQGNALLQLKRSKKTHKEIDVIEKLKHISIYR